MDLFFKKAALEDLELLTETRLTVLRAANKLDADADMSVIREQTLDYYRQALADHSHFACLVFDRKRFVGAGGVSFFRVLPTCHNPSGRKAYIMNMYTDPDYRRKGIAREVLSLLVREAKNKGITAISLEATEDGRPLYEKFGFIGMENEMELPE